MGGLGAQDKMRQVREMVGKVNPDILTIQETKLENWDSFLVVGISDSRFKD